MKDRFAKKITLFIVVIFALSTTLLYAQGLIPNRLDGAFSNEEKRAMSAIDFKISKSEDILASDGDPSENAVGITTSSQVSSTTDLKSYALFVVSEEGSLEEVFSRDEQVDVAYRKKVKLFGLFPVFMKYQAKVSLFNIVEGEVRAKVKVKEPWWYIFTQRDELPHEIAYEMEENIDLVLEENTLIEPIVYAKVIGTIRGMVDPNTATALGE